MVQHWYLFFLVACGIGAASSDALECSAEDSCFGYPTLCDPHNDCKILFKFDEQGNLDVQLNDFTNPKGFVAFVVEQWPDSTLEHLVCVPNAQRRLRVVARPGEKIQMTEQHMARYVHKFSNTNFKCTFMASELPMELKYQDSLFVSTGNFSDDMILPDGQPVFKVESDEVYIHRISAASKHDDGVLSVDEKKLTTDLIAKIGRIAARQEDDSELEDLLEDRMSSKKASRKEDDEDEDDLEDMLDGGKKYSTRRRQQRKEESRRRAEEEEEEEEEESSRRKSKNGRGSRHRDDDDDEEEDDDDDEDRKKRPVKKGKRPSRRHPADEEDDYQEEEEEEEEEEQRPKKRNNKKGKGRKQTPKSSDEEEYDDYASKDINEYEDSNSSNHIAPLAVFIATIYAVIH